MTGCVIETVQGLYVRPYWSPGGFVVTGENNIALGHVVTKPYAQHLEANLRDN